MNIRVIALDPVNPIRSQAIYHGLAANLSRDADPILVLLRPNAPYVCVGLHQDIENEVNVSWCHQNKLPIIRRHVGGGTVLLDQNQLFFQFIFPKQKVPCNPRDLYKKLLAPIVNCYQLLGCNNVAQISNDIHINQRKICGTGAATIENASVMVGSFLFGFDYQTMANCVNSPSLEFSATFCELMKSRMTVINDELTRPPSDKQIVEQIYVALNNQRWLTPIQSCLSQTEIAAIKASETELQDKEWIYQPGNRLIKNGIKIAAHSYLLEKEYLIDNLVFRIRILVCRDIIEQIWIEVMNQNVSNYYKQLVSKINLEKPQKDRLLSDFDVYAPMKKAIADLLVFNAY